MRLATRGRVASFAIVTILIAVTTVCQGRAAESTISGEVVETYCWAKLRVGGQGHAACGIECAKRGIPIAVVDESSRMIFILLPGRDKASIPPGLVESMGTRVTISGDVIKRSGGTFLSVQSWQRSGSRK